MGSVPVLHLKEFETVNGRGGIAAGAGDGSGFDYSRRRALNSAEAIVCGQLFSHFLLLSLWETRAVGLRSRFPHSS